MQIDGCGNPVASPSDRLTVFHVSKRDQAASGKGLSQFGRAMTELNIEIICANSPQAKGRVERSNLTLQDRLVKELRLCGISDMVAVQAYLPEFRDDYNRRFARAPRNAHDAHRPLQKHERLRRHRVSVHEHADGIVTLHHAGRVLGYHAHPKDQARITQGRSWGTSASRTPWNGSPRNSVSAIWTDWRTPRSHSMRAQASASCPVGFSSSTCFPAAKQRTAISSCRWCGSMRSSDEAPRCARVAEAREGARAGALGHRLRARRVGVDHGGDLRSRGPLADRPAGAGSRSRRSRRGRGRGCASQKPDAHPRSVVLRSSARRRGLTRRHPPPGARKCRLTGA